MGSDLNKLLGGAVTAALALGPSNDAQAGVFDVLNSGSVSDFSEDASVKVSASKRVCGDPGFESKIAGLRKQMSSGEVDATHVVYVKQNMEQVELSPNDILKEMKKQCPQYVDEGMQGRIEAALQYPEIKNALEKGVKTLGDAMPWDLFAVWLKRTDIRSYSPDYDYSGFTIESNYCGTWAGYVVD